MTGQRPLQGVRVIELGSFVAGPFCGAQLADFGADVVKIEKPEGGDTLRESGPFVNGESSIFMQVNRSKRSLALDIAAPTGADILRRLISTADVVIVSLRPDTVQRLGIDYASLSQLNTKLIYVAVSGWGLDGPYAHRPGFDIMAQAMSGIMSITGDEAGPPAKAGVPICDLACGLYATIGALIALERRRLSGRGQLIESSLFEAGTSLTLWEWARYQVTGEVPGALGSAHQSSAPYQAFRAQDGYITVGAASQRHWQKLCRALSLDELLSDPRFADNEGRRRHRQELGKFVNEALGHLTVSECMQLLERAGIPCAPVQTYDQVARDPQLEARNFFPETHHPRAGRIRHLRSGVRIGGDAFTPRASPVLGQHTAEILGELGMVQGEIESLGERGVVGLAADS